MSVNEDKDIAARTGQPEATPIPEMKARRELGGARGVTWEAAGWDAAMTDEEVDEFLGTGEDW